MKIKLSLLLASFLWMSPLHSSGVSGGTWIVVDSQGNQRSVVLSQSLVDQLRNNTKEAKPFPTLDQGQWKTLSTFKTLDGREGFVVQSDDGLVHTITAEK